MTDEPTSHMRMAGAATPATAKQTPRLKEVMTSVRQQHHHTPNITGTVVFTCKLHQSDPTMLIPGFDGAIAPEAPRKDGLPIGPAAYAGMHIIVDIGDAPGFRSDPEWEAFMTACLVHRAASVEVRGANPFGIARVRSDLAHALAHRNDEGAPVPPWTVRK